MEAESFRQRGDVGRKPFVDEGNVAALEDRQLLGVDLPVVLGMKDMMNRREADILVAASIARDEVPVQKFVVVSGGDAELIRNDRIAGVSVRIRQDRHRRRERVAVVIDQPRQPPRRGGTMRDIVEESVVRPDAPSQP